MSARPIVAGLVAVALLTGCGGGRNESASQPAVVAQKPAENPPAAVPAVETTPAASAEKPAAATTTAPAKTSPAATDPPFTPGTSLPGAIPPSPAVEVKSEKPVDPLVWLQQQQSRQADYKKRVAEAEASAQVAEVSVADWQRTILAFKNPFLPRPQLSAEDMQTIEGKDGIFRVNWAEGKLAAATAVRDAARKNVDDLKANPPSN